MPVIKGRLVDGEGATPPPRTTSIESRYRLPTIYLGIDPGLGGGMAVLGGWHEVDVIKMPTTERDVWDWVNGKVKYMLPTHTIHAVIEQQIPRPTSFFDRKTGAWRSSILKSTCLLYGSYMSLRAMLTASGIPWEECPPKRWQKALHIPPRVKGEEERHWKNRLKAIAQRNFPGLTVTLATADALLLALYCQRKSEGTL